MKTLLEALPLREQPAWRVTYQAESCSLVECLAAVIGGSRQLEIAQSLVSHFGSAQAIARATHDEIVAVEGIGPACAARLRAAMEFSRLLSMPDERNPPTIQSPEDAAALLLYRMQKLEQEHMMVLLLNTRNRLIGEPVEVYHGSLNSNLIRVSELLRPAVRANAASIILMHNHPSGDPTPSPEDLSVTKAIAEAGKMLDIEVLDHIIIGGGGRFISMKSRGLGFN
jgi:DNA repair protein RadC